MAASSNHVRATIGYYRPKADGTAPDLNDLAITLAFKDMDPQEVTINDIRGHEDAYHLEKQGFQIIKHSSAVDDFTNDEQVKSIYYQEVQNLIIKNTGASKVKIFNHMVRSGPAPTAEQDANDFMTKPPGPAPRVHLDQTPKGAQQMLKRLSTPEELDDFTSHRWQVINIWRPLKTVQRDPLAVADSRSIPESDLIAVKRIYPDGKDGENGVVKADGVAQHKWYYLSQQQPDEVLIFKQHESDASAVSHGTPHSSFQLPNSEELPTRESIEVRAFVCYE